MISISSNLLNEHLNQTKLAFQIWGKHLKRRWHFYLLPILLLVIFSQFFVISINISNSIKGKVFLTTLKVLPDKRGEYVSFYWPGDLNYPRGTQFTKRIAGIPGDEVTVVGRNVYVNGQHVGFAKEISKRGAPLEIIKPGRIPEGYIFVQGDHKDSLDSRYALCGLVNIKSIVGRSYLVF